MLGFGLPASASLHRCFRRDGSKPELESDHCWYLFSSFLEVPKKMVSNCFFRFFEDYTIVKMWLLKSFILDRIETISEIKPTPSGTNHSLVLIWNSEPFLNGELTNSDHDHLILMVRGTSADRDRSRFGELTVRFGMGTGHVTSGLTPALVH